MHFINILISIKLVLVLVLKKNQLVYFGFLFFKLSVVQKALGQLEKSYRRNESDSKQRVQEKREFLTAKSGMGNHRKTQGCC